MYVLQVEYSGHGGKVGPSPRIPGPPGPPGFLGPLQPLKPPGPQGPLGPPVSQDPINHQDPRTASIVHSQIHVPLYSTYLLNNEN